MASTQSALRFFLGAHAPTGFVSRMDQLTDPARFDRVVILKGGPDCAKSTLMARAAGAFTRVGGVPELICCAFDPTSLDAVILGRRVILDATAPHAIEPQHPGAVETLIWLGDCWDLRMLSARRDEIIALTATQKRLCTQSQRFLAAADALQADAWRLTLEAIDRAKIERTAARLACAELRGGQGGVSTARLLSAFTAAGPVFLGETALGLAERIFLVEDECGASAALLMELLRRKALSAGLDVLCCYSPMAPLERIEHLFVPSLSLGFMTCNHRLPAVTTAGRVINARRFTDRVALSAHKKKLAFHRKAAQQMLTQAQELLHEAGQVHRRLEDIYRAASDDAALDALCARLIDRLMA